MTPFKVLICGGRDFNDRAFFTLRLDQIFKARGWIIELDSNGNWLPNVHIIHGAAKGADTLADEYAVVNWCTFTEYTAKWKKYGRAAGPIRNQQMLDERKPDLVIAFPGGAGTTDMVRRAKEAGYEVIEVLGADAQS